MRALKLSVLVVVALAVAVPAAWGAAPVNVAAEVGIAQTTRTFSVNPFDFNRDGRDDFFLVRHAPEDLGAHIPPSTLYRRARARFVNHGDMFGRTDKHGCDWGDPNRDRRPDLACAVGLTQKSKNELWIQQPDGTFRNESAAWGLTVNPQRGRGRYVTFIHANNDRLPDLYFARYTGSCRCDLNEDGVVDYEGDEHPNELWINTGTSYRRAPEFGLNKPVGALKDNASVLQPADFDRDRDQDLLACVEAGLRLYRNNDGQGFTDVTRERGLGGGCADARFVDLDGDGWRELVRLSRRAVTVRAGLGGGRLGSAETILTTTGGTGLAFGRFNRGPTMDIYVLSSRGADKGDDPDAVLLQRPGGSFDPVVIPPSKGRGDDVASLDYNNDGRVDFLVSNGDQKKAGPLQLFTWR